MSNKIKKRNVFWIMLLVVALAVRFLVPIGAVMSDSDLEAMMQNGKSAEALAWAKEADGTNELRIIHELNNEGSLEIIEQLYSLGAAKVTAIDIESDPDFGETTNILIVELPIDPGKRKQLFKYESNHSGGFGFIGTTDEGQKYLFFYWT